LLNAAPPHVKLFLLLCSDLAIRSGTAIALGPENYDARAGILTFVTKCDEHLTLPVTDEIRNLIATCDGTSPQSFVRQLWQRDHAQKHKRGRLVSLTTTSLRNAYNILARSLGITRRITPHDYRRTTAVAMLQHSHDVREVQSLLGHKNLQSTLWYLDHDLRPIKRSTLELINSPAWRKEQTA
jgi:integrase